MVHSVVGVWNIAADRTEWSTRLIPELDDDGGGDDVDVTVQERCATPARQPLADRSTHRRRLRLRHRGSSSSSSSFKSSSPKTALESFIAAPPPSHSVAH